MPWRDVYSIWPDLIDQFCNDFPYLEKAALTRFRGDRNKLITYLADTHELTLTEAQDALSDWIAIKVKTPEAKLAA